MVNAEKPQGPGPVNRRETTLAIIGGGSPQNARHIYQAGLHGRSNGRGRSSMQALLRNFIDNESGATAIEYALIAGLIFLVIIPGVTKVGTKLTNTFGEVSSNLH
jgi:pilus assembly protein Flp/PilA